jgi:hypothetical protein
MKQNLAAVKTIKNSNEESAVRQIYVISVHHFFSFGHA